MPKRQQQIVQTSVYSVKSIKNALDVLEILSEFEFGAHLNTLSSRLQLSTNCTFRIMKTLCEKELVEYDQQQATYRLGAYSATLAHKFLKNISVISYAHPILEALVRKHDEAAYMAVCRDNEVIFLDMVDCAQQIKTASFVGQRVPFFTNAAGKVLRATDSRELLAKLLKMSGRRKEIPDLEQLDAELQTIRSSGVAIDRGGLGEDIISVAVAVRDYAGKVIGAITLIGPSFRLLADRVESEIVPSMLECAELLSMKFGYVKMPA
jgi:DNA-binding IclR family transcriptional regulator